MTRAEKAKKLTGGQEIVGSNPAVPTSLSLSFEAGRPDVFRPPRRSRGDSARIPPSRPDSPPLEPLPVSRLFAVGNHFLKAIVTPETTQINFQLLVRVAISRLEKVGV